MSGSANRTRISMTDESDRSPPGSPIAAPNPGAMDSALRDRAGVKEPDVPQDRVDRRPLTSDDELATIDAASDDGTLPSAPTNNSSPDDDVDESAPALDDEPNSVTG